METTADTHVIPEPLRSENQQALEDLVNGKRDPEAAKIARERMDRLREENRRLFGEQNCAVELIRATRDGSCMLSLDD